MNSKNLPLSHATSLIRVSILYFLVVTGFSGEWLNYCLMMFHSSNSKTGYVSQIDQQIKTPIFKIKFTNDHSLETYYDATCSI